VLDNFEQLVEKGGVSVVRALLAGAPGLTLLVTSRQILGLAGEREFAVAPLPTPGGAAATLEQLGAYDSVRLFIDRAQAVKPDFQVTNLVAPAVAELCARLEGIPLAIELAAARAQVLTPSQMLAQLSRRFDFLVSRKRDATGRHRTLREAIDWSYQLLSPELQRFFCRLSVFRGGWTGRDGRAGMRRAARLDYLAQLREGSLLLTERATTPTGRPRSASGCWTACATTRANGWGDRGRRGGHATAARRALRGRRARVSAPDPHGRRGAGAARAPRARRQPARGDRLGGGGWRARRRASRRSGPGGRHHAAPKGLPPRSRRPDRRRPGRPPRHPGSGAGARGAVCCASGPGCTSITGSGPRRGPRAEEARALFAALGDPEGQARAENLLGQAAMEERDFAAARRHFEPALRHFEAAGDATGAAIVRNNLGLVERRDDAGDKEAAARHLAEALRLRRSTGRPARHRRNAQQPRGPRARSG
jgi:tetratricopeptide (TPR) repeat protein